MSDRDVTFADLRHRVAEFVSARAWEQFHTPKNLSIAIAVEAAELMEHFQWLTTEQAAARLQDGEEAVSVAHELADVLIYGFSLANRLNIDVSDAMLSKLERNERRFPVPEWRGVAVRSESEEGST